MRMGHTARGARAAAPWERSDTRSATVARGALTANGIVFYSCMSLESNVHCPSSSSRRSCRALTPRYFIRVIVSVCRSCRHDRRATRLRRVTEIILHSYIFHLLRPTGELKSKQIATQYLKYRLHFHEPSHSGSVRGAACTLYMYVGV